MTMWIEQLFYTSCKKGFSTGMGFQTYSMSEGITEEERKEIETYCVYIPPDNLPTQPSDEEIKKLFPIAFSSFKLKSGKYCICTARYIGKDYSGRYGNYFCHVLVSHKPWDFYPIELYDSNIFRSRLTYEEENSSEIKFLPQIKEISLGNIINFDTIGKFLKGVGVEKRSKSFRDLIDSVVDYNKKGKKIILCDHKNNVPYWIGAIQMCLPLKIAQSYTFTTYSHNPENTDYIICAAYREGSRFNFEDRQKLYNFNIFDFEKIKKIEGILSSNFGKFAQVGYTVSKEAFLPFLKFLDQFEYNKLDEDIDHCVYLYNMVKKGIENADMESVKKAVSFANKYGSIEACSQLFEQLNPRLQIISTQVDIELTELITKFLFGMGRKIGNDEYVEKAYKFFFDSIHYLVMDREDIEVDSILKLYENIRNFKSVTVEEFTKVSLNADRINELITYLEGGKARHAKFYFKSAIHDIIAFNNIAANHKNMSLFNMKSKQGKSLTLFFRDCLIILLKSSDNILNILNDFKYKEQYFSEIICMIYNIINRNKSEQHNIEEELTDFIIDTGNMDEQWRNRVYSYINDLPGGKNIIFLLYKYELRESKDKKEFFHKYCENIFNEFKDYRAVSYSDALCMYLNSFQDIKIDLEEYKEIINYITNNSLQKHVEKFVLEKVISGIEDNIDIEDFSEEIKIIKKLYELKKEYKINTLSNVTEFIYIGTILENMKPTNKIIIFQNFKGDFSGIDKYRYEKYLKWCLPNICVHLNGYKEHGKLKKAMFCSEYEYEYYRQYINAIEVLMNYKRYTSILKDYNREPYQIFVDAVTFLISNMCSIKEDMEEQIYRKIISMLKVASDKEIKIYNDYFINEITGIRNKKTVVLKWEEIVKKSIQERPVSIMKKIKERFS